MALPRYSEPDEIAGMVAYLAGPEAAFGTGASLTIDGGLTAWAWEAESIPSAKEEE